MTFVPLFLYGTLRDVDILASVLGRAVSPGHLVHATAPGHATVYFPGQLYPALITRAGHNAPGLLLMEASPHDMAALDAFEGDDYRRARLTVSTAAGPITAQVYWPAIAIPPDARDWTLETWTRAHKPIVLARETELGRAARLGTSRR